MMYHRVFRHGKRYYSNKPVFKEGEILEEFLAHDIGSDTARFIEFVATDGFSNEANAAWIEVHGDTVLLGDLVDIILDRPEEECTVVTMSQRNMIDILKKWDRVLKEKPSEFWLTEKDGVYDLHFEKPEWVKDEDEGFCLGKGTEDKVDKE